MVAFLEPEGSTNSRTSPYPACDLDGDFDSVDHILRVFRLAGNEVVTNPLRAVDAAPRINGESLAVSGGLVFFRTSEAAMAQRLTDPAPARV